MQKTKKRSGVCCIKSPKTKKADDEKRYAKSIAEQHAQSRAANQARKERKLAKSLTMQPKKNGNRDCFLFNITNG